MKYKERPLPPMSDSGAARHAARKLYNERFQQWQDWLKEQGGNGAGVYTARAALEIWHQCKRAFCDRAELAAVPEPWPERKHIKDHPARRPMTTDELIRSVEECKQQNLL